MSVVADCLLCLRFAVVLPRRCPPIVLCVEMADYVCDVPLGYVVCGFAVVYVFLCVVFALIGLRVCLLLCCSRSVLCCLIGGVLRGFWI